MELGRVIKKKHIIVVGDVMLDTYYNGEINRISPEAPVPIFIKKSQDSVLGGAANVAANLVAAGQAVSILSVIGNDSTGKILKSKLEEKNVDCSLLKYGKRKTTEKIRLIAGNNQQVLRQDSEDIYEISATETQELLNSLYEKINAFDLILVSDYMKGVLTYDFVQGVIHMAEKNSIPVIIDVKDPKYGKYTGAYLLKPNLNELRLLTGMKVESNEEIILASKYLQNQCNCKYVLTTCGAKGMILVGNEDPFSIPSVRLEVFDVTGAGDTTISYIAACLANSIDITKAIKIANYAAGIQVSKVGTTTVTIDEVEHLFLKDKCRVDQKLIDYPLAKNLRSKYKDKKIVFTNGCFDILHVGHIRYLREASKLGDILVIGLNSDASVKRLKGNDRPINCELDRAELLCALTYVDFVIIFEDDTPYKLIESIKPDILVKGGDYKLEQVVGKDIMEVNGGKVELLPYVHGKSTTKIIKKFYK